MYIYYIFMYVYMYVYILYFYIILYIYIDIILYYIYIYIYYMYLYIILYIWYRIFFRGKIPPPKPFTVGWTLAFVFFDVCDGGCYGDQLPHIWSSSSPVHRPSLNKIATEPVNSAQGGKLYIYIYIYIYILYYIYIYIYL